MYKNSCDGTEVYERVCGSLTALLSFLTISLRIRRRRCIVVVSSSWGSKKGRRRNARGDDRSDRASGGGTCLTGNHLRPRRTQSRVFIYVYTYRTEKTPMARAHVFSSFFSFSLSSYPTYTKYIFTAVRHTALQSALRQAPTRGTIHFLHFYWPRLFLYEKEYEKIPFSLFHWFFFFFTPYNPRYRAHAWLFDLVHATTSSGRSRSRCRLEKENLWLELSEKKYKIVMRKKRLLQGDFCATTQKRRLSCFFPSIHNMGINYFVIKKDIFNEQDFIYLFNSV